MPPGPPTSPALDPLRFDPLPLVVSRRVLMTGRLGEAREVIALDAARLRIVRLRSRVNVPDQVVATLRADQLRALRPIGRPIEVPWEAVEQAVAHHPSAPSPTIRFLVRGRRQRFAFTMDRIEGGPVEAFLANRLGQRLTRTSDPAVVTELKLAFVALALCAPGAISALLVINRLRSTWLDQGKATAGWPESVLFARLGFWPSALLVGVAGVAWCVLCSWTMLLHHLDSETRPTPVSDDLF